MSRTVLDKLRRAIAGPIQNLLREQLSPARPVTLENLETRILMARVEGIDVSQWQGTIDWAQVHDAGKQFAFVRATRGNDFIDPKLSENTTNGWAAGMLLGAYHFALPDTSLNDAVNEANWFLSNAKQYMKPGWIRPVIDVESGSELGKTALSQWVNDFSNTIESATGAKPIIYTNGNYATNYLDVSVNDHDLWLARYNSGTIDPQVDHPQTPSGYPNPYGVWNVPIGSTTPSHDSWSFWQYTNQGTVAGITENVVDLNVFQGDRALLESQFVIPHAAGSFQGVAVNFGKYETPAPSGYINFADQLFTSVFGYNMGWNTTGAKLFTRNSSHAPDQRYQTYVMPNDYGGASRSFEIEVPSGSYRVRVVAGSPDEVGNTHQFWAEGVSVVNAVSNSTNRFASGVQTVQVTDGRLTISSNSGTAPYSRLTFVDVVPAERAGELPQAPTGATAIPASSTSIDVRWTDNADNDGRDPTTFSSSTWAQVNEGYRIERRDWNGSSWSSWSVRGHARANAELYQDTGLSAEAQYQYRVTAVNAAGQSAAVVAAAVTTPTTTSQQSYTLSGDPWPVPALIQAEDFDRGGQGVSYNDISAGNAGGFYRDGGGDVGRVGTAPAGMPLQPREHRLAWMRPTEWVEYTVNVPQGGEYLLQMRLSAPGPNGKFHVSSILGGEETNLAAAAPGGRWDVPNTGDWNTFVVVDKTVTLQAGVQVIRVYADTAITENPGVMDVDWLRIGREVEATGPTVHGEGAKYELVLSGLSGSATWQIDWGDGQTESVAGDLHAVEHLYAASVTGATITATMTDPVTGATYNPAPITVQIVPARPVALLASAMSTTSVRLTWVDSASVEDGYAIERSMDGGQIYTQIASIAANSTQHDVTGLDANTLYHFRVRATKGTASSADSNVAFAWTNAAVQVSGEAWVGEQELYTLTLNSGGNTLSGWTIDWGDGIVDTVSGAATSATHVYEDGPIDRVITAIAQDGAANYSTQPIAVHVGQMAPVLALSGSGVLEPGQPYVVNFVTDKIGQDVITKWYVNWGDNSPVEEVAGSATSVSHQYANSTRSYTIQAVAVDRDGSYAAPAHAVDPSSSGFVMLASADTFTAMSVQGDTLVVGGPLADWQQFTRTGTGTITAAADNGITLVEGTSFHIGMWREVTIPAEVQFLEFAYADLVFDPTTTEPRIRDAFEAALVDLVTGKPVVPTIDAGRDAFFNITHALPIEIKQALGVDSQAGAGEGVVRVNVSHLVGQTLRFELRLVNNDGDTNSTVTIGGQADPNTAPDMAPLPPLTVQEGGIATFEVTFTDPDAEDTHWVDVDWGDNVKERFNLTGGERTITLSHVYADDKPDGQVDQYLPTVTVTDSAEAFDTEHGVVNVSNVAPSLSASMRFESVVRENVRQLAAVLSGTFTDPGWTREISGISETFQIDVNWGDGTSQERLGKSVVNGSDGVLTQGRFTGSHVYAEPGLYEVTVTVSDHDGGVVSQTFKYAVMNIRVTRHINLKSDGTIPVMILPNLPEFDPALVNVASLRFGPGGAPDQQQQPVGTHGAQVNFLVEKSRIRPTDTYAFLYGELQDGTPFVGMDDIVITHGSERGQNGVPATDTPKFFVADTGTDRAYRYTAAGVASGFFDYDYRITEPRGIAANPVGDTLWTIESNGQVAVHRPTNEFLGKWQASDVTDAVGITTDGADIWIADKTHKKVFRYSGAAAQREGIATAQRWDPIADAYLEDAFPLAAANASPSDLVTDGISIWVVDDGANSVFKYTLGGVLLGSWALDAANASPSGIAWSEGQGDLWVVDRVSKRVYQYVGATEWTDGQQHAAASSFVLASAQIQPEGIADPPVFEQASVTPTNGSPIVQDTRVAVSGNVKADFASGSPIVRVTVDGQTAPVIDAAGNFFATVKLAQSDRRIEIVATDADGGTQIRELTLRATGWSTNRESGEVDTSLLVDVTPQVAADYGRTSFAGEHSRLFTGITLKNRSEQTLYGPVVVAVKNLAGAGVRLVGADGVTSQGWQFIDISDELDAFRLLPDATRFMDLTFDNPNHVPFSYELAILANPNHVPHFHTVPVTTLRSGGTYRYSPTASDFDGEDVVLSLGAHPSWMAGGTVDGAFSLVSNAVAPAGTYPVTIVATDERGGRSEQSFVVTVSESSSNTPPHFTSTAIVDAYVADPYAYDSDAVDPDGDDIIYAVTSGPVARVGEPATATLAINATNGLIEWTPLERHLGTHEVVVEADDGRGGTVEHRFTIAVHPAKGNHDPIIISEPSEQHHLPKVPGASLDPVTPTSLTLTLGEEQASPQSPVSISLPVGTGKADVVFVVDESGSMNTEHAWLSDMVLQLQSEMTAQGVTDVAYGLAGFSSSSLGTRAVLLGSNQQLFGTAQDVADAGSQLLTDGGYEDGYHGIKYVLQNYPLRADATPVFVLITDEDRDPGPETFDSILTGLRRNPADAGDDILLHLVSNSKLYADDGDDVGVAGQFTVREGTWTASPLAYRATPSAAGQAALTTADERLVIPDIGTGFVDTSITFESATGAAEGLIVFDYKDDSGYLKFAGLDAANNRWVIGEKNASGWQYHQQAAVDVVVGRTYELSVELDITGAAELFVDGILVGTHAYANEYFADVRTGLATRNGAARFGFFRNGGWAGSDLSYDGYNTSFGGTSVLGVDALHAAFVPSNGAYSLGARGEHLTAEPVGGEVPGGTSWRDYTLLAWQTGGAVWDLNQLRANDPMLRDSFSSAFVENVTEDVSERTVTLSVTDPSVGFSYEPNLSTPEGNDFLVTFTGDGRAHRFDLLFRDATGGELGAIPVAINAAYEYDLHAIDPDEDVPLTFSWVEGALTYGATLVDGRIIWNPSTTGPHDFAVQVSDGRGGIDVQTWTVQVGQDTDTSNLPPQITATTPMSASAAGSWEFPVVAEDPDGDQLRYYLIEGPNGEPRVDGMSIDRNTGVVSWVPGFDQSGTHPFWVLAADGRGGEASHGYSVTVAAVPPPNRSPQFIETPPPPAAVAVGARYDFRLLATDLDADQLWYRLVLAPKGMALDPATGEIRWDVSAGELGTHDVTAVVEDRRGGTDILRWQVEVDRNDPPVFTRTFAPSVVRHGSNWTDYVEVADPNGDAFTLLLDERPTGLSHTVTELTGGGLRVTFNWSPTAAKHPRGMYRVSLVATDSTGAATPHVFDIPVAPSGSGAAPTIENEPSRFAQVDQPYLWQIEAADEDLDPISYELLDPVTDSVVTSLHGATLDANGLLKWDPAAVGSYNFKVRVKDVPNGIGEARAWTVTVASQVPANVPPQIDSSPVVAAVAGEVYTYDAKGFDLDHNTPLIWSLDEAPDGLTVDPVKGLLVWAPGVAHIGVHDVSLRLTDSRGGSAVQVFKLQVVGANRPPVILNDPPANAIIGQEYVWAIAAQDPDNDPLSYRITDLGDGTVHEPLDGVFRWTPPGTEPFARQFRVELMDGQHTVGGTFTVAVNTNTASNEPPVILNRPLGIAGVGQGYAFVPEVEDPDHALNELTWTLGGTITSAPGFTTASFNAQTGAIDWTPEALANGNAYSVVLRVTDPVGAFSELSGDILVRGNAAPVIDPPVADLAATAGMPVLHPVYASDSDVDDQLTYRLDNAPAWMSIDAFGQIIGTPDAAMASADVTVVVTDRAGQSVSDVFNVTVTEDTTAPTVEIHFSVEPAIQGETIQVYLVARDSSGVVARTLEVRDAEDGTSVFAPVQLDHNGVATINLSSAHAHDLEFRATAVDSRNQASAPALRTLVVNPPPVGALEAALAAGLDGTVLTGAATITGTITGPGSFSWTLLAQANGGGEPIVIATGTDSQPSGVFDATARPNGGYTIRLIATAGTARAEDAAAVMISSDFKLGDLKLSFVDVNLPLAGVPLQVVRSYDSLAVNREGDFGYGWTMNFRDAELSVSEHVGIHSAFGTFPAYQTGTRVWITLPGGQREEFIFQPEPDGNIIGQTWFYPRFIPTQGTEGQLSPEDPNLWIDQLGDDWVRWGTPEAYNPADPAFGGIFRYTTPGGDTFVISAETGRIEDISDNIGNRVHFVESTDVDGFKTTRIESRNPINHLMGAITIERKDNRNRVTRIIDPLNNQIDYAYDADGNLSGVTRDVNATTRQHVKLVYDTDPSLTVAGRSRFAHYLRQIVDLKDPANANDDVLMAMTDFDSSGRLSGIRDAEGGEVTTTYDAAARKQTTVANGITTVTEYDAQGNVSHVVQTGTDSSTREVFYVHDTDNNLREVKDHLNRITKFDYHADGQLKSVTEPHDVGEDPARFTTYFTFNDRGQMTSVVDPNGAAEIREYNGHGDLQKVSDHTGTTLVEWAYDGFGRVISEGNGEERITIGYEQNTSSDQYGYPTTVTLPGDEVITSTYNAAGLLKTFSETSIGTSVMEYDALGRVEQASYADAADPATPLVVDYAYGDDGRAVDWTSVNSASTGQLGRSMSPSGRLDGWQLSNGGSAGFAYAQGRLDVSTDALGGQTKYHYDAFGRTERVENLSTGGFTTYGYDAANRVTSVTTADGTTQQLYGDCNCGPEQTSNPRDFIFKSDHDGLTRSVTGPFTGTLGGTLVSLPETRTTSVATNAAGLPIRITNADGSFRSFEYSGGSVADEMEDALTLVRDEMGHERRYSYWQSGDAGVSDTSLGQLKTATDLAGKVTSFAYDDEGRLERVTPAGDKAELTVFGYDEEHRVTTVSHVDPAAPAISVIGSYEVLEFSPDSQPQLVKLPHGQYVRFAYETVDLDPGAAEDPSYTGRLKRRDVFDADPRFGTPAAVESYEFHYDFANQVTSVKNLLNAQTTDYTYETLAGGPTGRLQRIDYPSGASIRYEYDMMDRIEKVHTRASASGVEYTTTYGYDANGNLQHVIDPINGAANPTTFTYDGLDRMKTRTLPNGVQTTWDYDNRDRVTKLEHRNGATVLASFTYDYGIANQSVGQPLKVTREDGSYVSLGYDDALRLEREEYHDGAGQLVETIVYAYDEAGNRTSRTFTPAVGSAVTQSSALQAGYQLDSVSGSDGNHQDYDYDGGGRTTLISRAGLDATLAYNDAGQVTAVNGSTVDVDYLYDAEGRRVRSVAGGTARDYLVAPTPYGYDSTYMVAGPGGALQAGFVYAGENPILRFDGSGGVSYYLEDAMDSVIGLVNGSGGMTATYAYDGFGNARGGSGSPNNPATGGEFGYHGAWLENATGLYHMRARDYDPVTGRFVSRDPVEPAQTAPETYNPYVFANSNPQLYTDPTGGFSVAEINIGAAIQNGLQNWRAVAANYVRRKAVSVARELTVDTIQQVLGRTLPIGGLIRDVERMTYAFQQGNTLGGWIRNNICNLLGNPGDIWFEVPLRVDGTPVGDGFTCDERGNQRFPGGQPIAGTKRPDVIFGPHAPLEQAAGTAGDNWLATEVKIKLTTAISDVKRNPNQLDAMVNYIKRYTPVPIGSWVFLFTGARTKTMKAQLVGTFERTLIGKGIAGVLVFLTEREGPRGG